MGATRHEGCGQHTHTHSLYNQQHIGTPYLQHSSYLIVRLDIRALELAVHAHHVGDCVPAVPVDGGRRAGGGETEEACEVGGGAHCCAVTQRCASLREVESKESWERREREAEVGC